MAQNKASEDQPDDKFAVSVVVDGAKARRKFVDTYHLDYGESADPRERENALTFFATKAEIAQLENDGFKLERGANMSARGRERMAEIDPVDDYAEGKNIPTGLGRKLKER